MDTRSILVTTVHSVRAWSTIIRIVTGIWMLNEPILSSPGWSSMSMVHMTGPMITLDAGICCMANDNANATKQNLASGFILYPSSLGCQQRGHWHLKKLPITKLTSSEFGARQVNPQSANLCYLGWCSMSQWPESESESGLFSRCTLDSAVWQWQCQ
jgi:hypothetical protein